MQDTEFYEQILGLSAPWSVTRVEVSTGGSPRVDVWASAQEGTVHSCPECGAASPLHDHAEERRWRHLDTCQFATYLHVRPPRVRCKEHGVRQVKLPWAEERSRFTLLFERLAIEVLSQTTVQGGCKLLRVSWDEGFAIMKRAVARGQARRAEAPPHPQALGVDEKSIRKRHRYMTIVRDIESGHVLEAFVGRDKEGLQNYFDTLSEAQKACIEAVTMDMWPAYIGATKESLPEADIVFDPFHIVQHMNRAIDQVRRAESRELAEFGEEPVLKGMRYAFLYGKEKLSVDTKYAIERLRKANLKTAKAWAIKEHLRGFFRCASENMAEVYWETWNSWASHCRLAPVARVAKMIREHKEGVFQFFNHRLTNAGSEAINSVIQKIKAAACGYRNDNNFRTAILFHCGGLNMYP